MAAQLFSNAAHGNALSTFSRLVAGHGATVLAVEDTRGAVFGGYCPVPWQAQRRFERRFDRPSNATVAAFSSAVDRSKAPTENSLQL